MSSIKGKINAVITLSPSTCYYMRTGKCSLEVIKDFYIPALPRTTAADLLYCPKLYKAMCSRDKHKPVSLTPCECGHAEIVSGHQRACIASKKGIELFIKPTTGGRFKKSCPTCEGQLTFEKDQGTHRIVNLSVIVKDDYIK